MLELLTIAAIVIGPIAAVQIEKRLEARRERSRLRTDLFKTLMVHRASPLAHENVAALNSITMVFHGKRFERVRSRWRTLLNHFGAHPDPNLSRFNEALVVWTAKRNELTGELLQEMGRSLGFDFDDVEIQSGSYFPQGHGSQDLENQIIREGAVRILTGDQPLNVRVVADDGQREGV